MSIYLIYGKFHVSRVDGTDGPGGKHEHCRYFVLDMSCDPHAIAAAQAYADSCAETRPALAADLREWAAELACELYGDLSRLDRLALRHASDMTWASADDSTPVERDAIAGLISRGLLESCEPPIGCITGEGWVGGQLTALGRTVLAEVAL